jgi:DNA-directed RNA polymerase I, II, and III subunit RPABC2
MNNIVDYTDLYQNYDISKNITTPNMTKYEYTQCLGMRAQQIAMGAEPLIEVTEDLDDVILIATEELRQRKTPFIIKRKIGDNEFEFWKIEDMIIDII